MLSRSLKNISAQIIDDENYTSIHDVTEYNESFGEKEPEKLQDWQMTGANYAMHTIPDNVEKVLYPTGQWNSSKILFTKSKVEHWLNDVLLFSFKPWSDKWYKLRNSGKWDQYPDYGKFKTPTLRNIEFTAPYMHDGRFNTLEEVVEHYNSGGVPSSTIDTFMKYTTGGLQLAPAQKEALIAFLNTLTDETYINNPDFQDPF